jgi:hypothetical protein
MCASPVAWELLATTKKTDQTIAKVRHAKQVRESCRTTLPQKGIVNADHAIAFDEAQFSELVHEQTGKRTLHVLQKPDIFTC